MSKHLKVHEIVDSISITHKFDKDLLYAVNTSDVLEGQILEVELTPVKQLKGQFKKTIQKDDILFSEIRPQNKRYAKVVIEDAEDYVVSTKLMVLRKKTNEVDLDYFYYWLTNNDFLQILQSRAENRICSFPQITFDLLGEYDVPVFEPKIQKKIAGLLKSIDNKIQNNNKINESLENMANEIYEYWFLQFNFPNQDGKPYKSSGGKMVWNEELKRKIPEGWSVLNVKDCIQHINTGLNPRDNFQLGNGKVKYITVKNITTSGGLDFLNCDVIDEDARKIIHKRSDVSKGDILFASIAPLGRCFLVQEEPETWDINESVFSIRPNYQNVTSEYLYMFFMSDYFVKVAEHSSSGSVFSGIRVSTLEEMKLIVPTGSMMKLFTEQIKTLLYNRYRSEKENQELASLRDFLLPLLLNGQVGFKE